MTSEKEYEITKQPEETCPLVDKAIKAVTLAQDHLSGYEKLEEAELKHVIWLVELELGEIVGYRGQGSLEDIRESNQRLRQWGQEWKEKALELDEELESLKTQQDSLTT